MAVFICPFSVCWPGFLGPVRVLREITHRRHLARLLESSWDRRRRLCLGRNSVPREGHFVVGMHSLVGGINQSGRDENEDFFFVLFNLGFLNPLGQGCLLCLV